MHSLNRFFFFPDPFLEASQDAFSLQLRVSSRELFFLEEHHLLGSDQLRLLLSEVTLCVGSDVCFHVVDFKSHALVDV
jgi:hypothetical protein